MMRIRKILPLAAALFALAAPVWAVEAKTTEVDINGSVHVGNPLSGGQTQIGQPQPGMGAPGLLPSIGTPVGSPKVQDSKTAPAALSLDASQNIPSAPSVSQIPSLPQSVLKTPSDGVPPSAGPIAPAAGTVQASPGDGLPTGPAAARSADQPRGPPEEEPALIKRARRYIRDIIGSRVPTDSETEALLQDYMEAEGIQPTSDRGQSLRSELLASKIKAEDAAVAQLDPQFKTVGPAILAAAKEYGVTPAHVEEVVKKRGLAATLAGAKSKEQAGRILDSVLARNRFDRALAHYPKNRQGDLMREVANSMLVRSGKSIEEVSRDGVFVYADFRGRTLTNASVGRDPDPQYPNVLFYVRFEDAKWRIDVYRQNRSRGFQGGPDTSFVEAFKNWLTSGGVPRSDLLAR